jgi:hypothetical protein
MTITSVSVPLTEVSESQLQALRNQLQEELLKIMETEAGVQRRDVSLRDMVPADYSGVANDTQFVNQVVGVADTFPLLTTANPLLTATQAFGFYGFFDRAAVPTITILRFSVGGSTRVAQFGLEDAFATGQNGVIFLPPVLFHPTDTIQINVGFSAATAAGAEVCGFLGLVAEKIGTVISGRGNQV